MQIKHARPVIGITMGDPAGIGPEILLSALARPSLYKTANPVVIGDLAVLEAARRTTGAALELSPVPGPEAARFSPGTVDVIALSDLSEDPAAWGAPTAGSGRAMIDYIERGIDLALEGKTHALVTGPINKTAMKLAESEFHGHTELLAHRTGAGRFAMMMAGPRLRIVLVTIHIPLRAVPEAVTPEKVLETIRITHEALKARFGIEAPKIAVAGLNPHAGEEGLFGDEEPARIEPALEAARASGIAATGPYPPDTVYHRAAAGQFDAVIAMYHDQGLIPFKMIHFEDGVNTTIGLPIIRTSVDHGTAYDIAGTGKADPASLAAAVRMAALQASFRRKP